jgi:Inosine-uridine preferring nucleoside hydrolase
VAQALECKRYTRFQSRFTGANKTRLESPVPLIRMFRAAFLVIFALLIPLQVGSATVPDVIIDQDGGVDDLVAISLLMKSPAVHVRAIAICPADSYLDAATRATRLFVDRLGGRDIVVAQGHSEGTNPFPAQWRRDAGNVLGIAALAGAPPKSNTPIAAEPAAQYLVKRLSGTQSYTILETGPLTNIADALRISPSIKRNITRIYIMGRSRPSSRKRRTTRP